MAPRTRSATSSPVKKPLKPNPAEAKDDGPLPLLFILPRNLSQDARFISLKDSRDDQLRRYLFCPREGIYEFTKITSTSFDPRSVLFASDHAPDSEKPAAPSLLMPSLVKGHIVKNSELLVATPVDPIFPALPLLRSSATTTEKRLLQSIDDLLDSFEDSSSHLRYIIRNETYREKLEKALGSICDTVDAGEKMFRLNEEKLFKVVVAKAEYAVAKGLPASLEEHFVSRALESPVLSIKREEAAVAAAIETPEDDADEVGSENTEERSSFTETTASTLVSTSSSVTINNAVAEEGAPEEFVSLLKLRVALTFITSSYLPKDLSAMISRRLGSKESPIDFTPLDQRLDHLAKLRAEALASRSMSDFSRKRGPVEDDEAVEARAEKKRKQEEEEKRKKASESRGVKELKKVNVAGMKKLSSFFAKKPPTAKTKS